MITKMTYGRRLLKKSKRKLVEIRIQNTKGRLIEKYLLKILNKTKLVKKNALVNKLIL